MAIEYLGHKEGLLDFLLGAIRAVAPAIGPRTVTVADLFCGTGVVAAALKRDGYRVVANDNLVWCATSAEALLLNSAEPEFAGVVDECRVTASDLLPPRAYDRVLAHLSALPPVRGFVWRSYSPASHQSSGVARMYFSEENAARIDAARAATKRWWERGQLTRGEHALLVRDLVRAANRHSNIAGTYGCYLKHWKARALEGLVLKPSRIVSGSTEHEIRCEDANVLASLVAADVVYADPPYTKRQYAAYYHVLETIAVGDEPELTGSTGLRPWRDKASSYCLRRTAPGALADLVGKVGCAHFFLSYNGDGQIQHETILDILGAHGEVRVLEVPYRRYKSSSRPHKGAVVTERLYHLARN